MINEEANFFPNFNIQIQEKAFDVLTKTDKCVILHISYKELWGRKGFDGDSEAR